MTGAILKSYIVSIYGTQRPPWSRDMSFAFIWTGSIGKWFLLVLSNGQLGWCFRVWFFFKKNRDEVAFLMQKANLSYKRLEAVFTMKCYTRYSSCIILWEELFHALQCQISILARRTCRTLEHLSHICRREQ